MSSFKSIIQRSSHLQDKGYAWMILFWSALSHALHIGFSFAVVGNLTIAHKEYFKIDLQQSSLIGTVHTGVIFLFGPVASVLLKKAGCRVTQIVGGCCCVLGYGLSALSTQPWHAYLLFGVFAGVGVSCTYISSSQILADNFRKYKHLAFAVAVVVQYVGGAVWPVTSQKLLSTLGYPTAMGVMSSFHSLLIIAGLFFTQPSSSKDGENELTCNREEARATGETNIAVISQLEQEEQNAGLSNNANQQSSIKTSNKTAEVASGSIVDDFKVLLKSPKVWAVLVNGMLWNANITSYYVFVNDFILHKTGSSKDEVALGLTILGGCCVAGALVVSAISFLKFDRTILSCVCSGLYGVTTIAVAFTTGKVMFYVLSGIWGCLLGAFLANLLGFANTFCDVNKLALLFGLILLSEGISVLGSTPIVGYVSAEFGAQYGIILTGCFGVMSSFVMLPVVIANARQRKEPNNQATNDAREDNL